MTAEHEIAQLQYELRQKTDSEQSYREALQLNGLDVSYGWRKDGSGSHLGFAATQHMPVGLWLPCAP